MSEHLPECPKSGCPACYEQGCQGCYEQGQRDAIAQTKILPGGVEVEPHSAPPLSGALFRREISLLSNGLTYSVSLWDANGPVQVCITGLGMQVSYYLPEGVANKLGRFFLSAEQARA